MTLPLKLSCGAYDRTQALIDGTVKAEGIDLEITTLPSPERHKRMLVNREFDVCELSLASYFIGRERDLALCAIPVFPHRRFRHGYIFVNKAAGIRQPQDLSGKRVGIRRFQNTASVWVRGILSDEYGVARSSIPWFTEGDEELAITLPPSISSTRVRGQTLDKMLESGELDAVIYPETLPSLSTGTGQVTRLFPDYKEVEIEYFRKTGNFPLMHAVVVKAEILQHHPWVAGSLWRAFEQAKAACYAYVSDQRRSSLAWFGAAWEEQVAILGPDPWPYDLPQNLNTLETLARYLVEDGLISRVPRMQDEFIDVGR